MRRLAACVAAVVGLAGAASAADDTPAPPSYTKDIKPFLATYCMNCHSDARPRAGVAVETYTDLMTAGRRGTLVAPGKPDDSRLLAVLGGGGKPMPPRRSRQPKADEIAKVREWIKAGAVDDATAAQPSDDKKTPTADDKKAPPDSGKP